MSSLRRRYFPKSQDGFTLTELLVVISIIGILSAIGMPSFLSQVNRARETEAQLAVNTLKKEQYDFYLSNGQFGSSLEQLNFPTAQTDHYYYSVQQHPRLTGRLHLAFSKRREMRSYASVVHLEDGHLKECSLLTLNVSGQHSGLEIFYFLVDAIENYEQYCP